MESGSQLVLYKHTRVYGSLYDLLNQSYTIIGDKRNCRVALGASVRAHPLRLSKILSLLLYSRMRVQANPACNVHADFRCVVVVDDADVDAADPPFLNRFEKHRVSSMDALPPRLAALVPPLAAWVRAAATIYDGGRVDAAFTLADAFPSFGLPPSLSPASDASLHEPLAALVLQLALEASGGDAAAAALQAAADPDALPAEAMRRLLACGPADAALRLRASALARVGAGGALDDEARCLMDERLRSPAHASLAAALRAAEAAPRLLLLTFSGVAALKSGASALAAGGRGARVVVLELAAMSCEAAVFDALDKFWRLPGAATLLVHADAAGSGAHLALCKHLVEHRGAEWARRAALDACDEGACAEDAGGGGGSSSGATPSSAAAPLKRAVLVVTLRRSASRPPLPFSALSGWRQLCVDALDGDACDTAALASAQSASLVDWVAAGGAGLPDSGGEASPRLIELAKRELGWCLRRLEFPTHDRPAVAAHLASAAALLASPGGEDVLLACCAAALGSLQAQELQQKHPALGAAQPQPHWLTALARNKAALLVGGTMAGTLRGEAGRLLRAPLARVLHVLQLSGGIPSLLALHAPDAPPAPVSRVALRRMWFDAHAEPAALRAAAADRRGCSFAVPSLVARVAWPLSPLVSRHAAALVGDGCRLPPQLLPRRLVAEMEADAPHDLQVLLTAAAEVAAAEAAAADAPRVVDDSVAVAEIADEVAVPDAAALSPEEPAARAASDDGSSSPFFDADDRSMASEEAADAFSDGAAEELEAGPVAPLTVRSEAVEALLSAFAGEYASDVLDAASLRLAPAAPRLERAAVAAFLRRAVAVDAACPMGVHAQLWRADGCLRGVLELSSLLPVASAAAVFACGGRLADVAVACGEAACARLLGSMAAESSGGRERFDAWARASTNALLTFNRVLDGLSVADTAAPAASLLRAVLPASRALFAALPPAPAAAAVAGLAAAAAAGDGPTPFALARAALAHARARTAAGSAAARALDTAFAWAAKSALLAVPPAPADVGDVATLLLRRPYGGGWPWADHASPPLRASAIETLLFEHEPALRNGVRGLVEDGAADALYWPAADGGCDAPNIALVTLVFDVLHRAAAEELLGESEWPARGAPSDAACRRLKAAADLLLRHPAAPPASLRLLCALAYAKEFLCRAGRCLASAEPAR